MFNKLRFLFFCVFIDLDETQKKKLKNLANIQPF